jgi:hypothetical protein
MFVKWRSKRRRRPVYLGRGIEGDVLWSARVIRAFRANGRSTSQQLGYLGSILQSEINKPRSRAEFWTKAIAKLDAIDYPITGAQREKIEDALEAKVSRPTKREIRDAERMAAATIKRLERSLGAVLGKRKATAAIKAATLRNGALSITTLFHGTGREVARRGAHGDGQGTG